MEHHTIALAYAMLCIHDTLQKIVQKTCIMCCCAKKLTISIAPIKLIDYHLALPLLSTNNDRQGVDILFTVFVCVWFYLFVRLRIFPPRTKLVVSNFAWRFISIQDRESHILGNLAPPEPKIGRISQRVGHARQHVNITVEIHRCKCHASDAPFVKLHGVWA